jgi:SAM-dependent methyltransferase
MAERIKEATNKETANICRICRKPFVEHPMGEKNGYTFAACKACGSIMTAPWPTQQELDQYFADIQPEAVHAYNYQQEIKSTKNLFVKLAKNYFGGNISGKRFLDACCRQGYGVQAAKELGFQAHGIDAHSFFVAFAKDKYDASLFEQATAGQYAERGQQADFIYVAEGLCEQVDPDSYIAALAKILSPRGKIYLHEPHGNHMRLPVIFANWGFVEPPLNFFYPSKKGMEILLGRHGLVIEKSFFSWSPFMRLIVGHK